MGGHKFFSSMKIYSNRINATDGFMELKLFFEALNVYAKGISYKEKWFPLEN